MKSIWLARPKLLMLDERRTILSGLAEELIRDERVRKAYVGEE